MSGLTPVTSQSSANSFTNGIGSDGSRGQFPDTSSYSADRNNQFSSFPSLQNYDSFPSLSNQPMTIVGKSQAAEQSFVGLPDSVRKPGTPGQVPFQTGNGGTGTLTVTPASNGASGTATTVVNQGGSRVTAQVSVAAPNAVGQQVVSGSVSLSQLVGLGQGNTVRVGATVGTNGVGVNAEANLAGGVTATAGVTGLNGTPSLSVNVRQQSTPGSVSVGIGYQSTPTGSSATVNIGNVPVLGGVGEVNGAIGVNNGAPNSSAGAQIRWSL